MTVPVALMWDGERFTPLPQFRRICDKQFVVGEIYPMTVEERRSSASHRHFFAAVHDAWMNLPEKYADRFPTDDHLRRWVLIHTGYADERAVVCDTVADAVRLAALARGLDGFAVIVVKKNIVQIFTAKSQSIRTMKSDDFKASKKAVLDYLSGMIGVTPGELNKSAERGANA